MLILSASPWFWQAVFRPCQTVESMRAAKEACFMFAPAPTIRECDLQNCRMIPILGIVIVLGAIAGGYLMEHGKFALLMQPAELVIILGSAIGTVVIANPIPTLIRIGKG